VLSQMHSDQGMLTSLPVGNLRHVYASFQDMNYQGSTCICRVPKAQVRSGTVVECVHCGACISFSFSPTTDQFVQDAAAAAQIPRTPITWVIVTELGSRVHPGKTCQSRCMEGEFGKWSCSVHTLRSIFVSVCVSR